VIAGLGGRAITRASLARMLRSAGEGTLGRLSFLDLDEGMVSRALAREKAQRRSGPLAEALLRDVGAIASRPA
jgi:pyruvate ferredoxin oxidoreductase alpha subunit